MEKILVLGASPNKGRVSNQAVHKLKMAGYHPIPLGVHDGEIAGYPIIKGMPELEGITGVTLYLNADRQVQYYDYVVGLGPKYVIFNPGTENPVFINRLKEAGVKPVIACNLTLLALDIMPKFHLEENLD